MDFTNVHTEDLTTEQSEKKSMDTTNNGISSDILPKREEIMSQLLDEPDA
jgi:hypothetical protein